MCFQTILFFYQREIENVFCDRNLNGSFHTLMAQQLSRFKIDILKAFA